MKNLSLLIAFAFLFICPELNAQILNGSFEKVNPDGTPQFWGNAFNRPVSFTLGGGVQADSLQFDTYMYGAGQSAFSGNRALELRNAFNVTTQTPIPVSVSIDDDSVFSAWGNSPLIRYANQPRYLSFNYKYLPAGADIGEAQLLVFDSAGVQIGAAIVPLTGTQLYTPIHVPVAYTRNAEAVSVSLTFSTAAPNSAVNYGTKLLIDDVVVVNYNKVLSVTGSRTNMQQLLLFPNPATGEIFADVKGKEGAYTILNKLGQKVQAGKLQKAANRVMLENISPGMYTFVFEGEDTRELQRFVVIK